MKTPAISRRRRMTNEQARRDRLKEEAQGLPTPEVHRRARAYVAMLEALEMVRDADDDSHRDRLPTIPAGARARIDAAIALAKEGAPEN